MLRQSPGPWEDRTTNYVLSLRLDLLTHSTVPSISDPVFILCLSDLEEPLRDRPGAGVEAPKRTRSMLYPFNPNKFLDPNLTRVTEFGH